MKSIEPLIIIGVRKSGKTKALCDLAKANKGIVVCRNSLEAKYIKEKYEVQAKSCQSSLRGYKNLYVDECMEELMAEDPDLGMIVRACTINTK